MERRITEYPVTPVPPCSNSTLVKICGLTDEAAARAAALAGADMLGFVFAPSRRRVTPERAGSVIRAVRSAVGAGRAPGMVGVFVDECPLYVNSVAALCGLDYAQLCGHEDASEAGRLALPAIVACSVSREGISRLEAWRDRAALLLFDSQTATERGGTGRTGDWGVAARLARRHPLVLAGGLTPENVAAAIAAVGPLGVDVSSGVETNGRKDPAKVFAFIRAAKAAANPRRHVGLRPHS